MYGDEITPNSAYGIDYGVLREIDEEFTDLNTVATKLHNSAKAHSLINGLIYKVLLGTMIEGLDSLTAKMKERALIIVDKLDKGAKYGHSSFWIIFAFMIVTVILSACIWFIIYRNQKLGGGRLRLGRALLVILSLFILGIWIVLFVMLAGSALLSGSCGFLVEINRNNKEMLDYFELDPMIKDAAHHCIFHDSDG